MASTDADCSGQGVPPVPQRLARELVPIHPNLLRVFDSRTSRPWRSVRVSFDGVETCALPSLVRGRHRSGSRARAALVQSCAQCTLNCAW